MPAVAMLDEDECYLFAILDDPSGIDLAEFMWTDEEQPDSIFRCWDFQWPLYRNESTFQIDWMGRSLGKTNGILMRAFAFPFNYPGAEMLITAPELNHLGPIVKKVESTILKYRLTRELLPNKGAGRSNGITKQPQFEAQFSNGARIISRIPNRDGRGVKGQHSLIIEMDEGQDYPENGWIEIIETMKYYVPGAQWRVHGVSRGIRDRFYRYTAGAEEDRDIPFYVHRYMAMHRPSWGPEERKAKIAIYGGSQDNVDYRRNIYGDHGDATNQLFVLHRLMACVRIAESPWATEYNDNVYTAIKINDELLQSSGAPIEHFLQLPGSHLEDRYTSYWGGQDVGFTRDPSEILIFGELKHPDKNKISLLRLLTRVHLMRISAENQAAVVRALFDFYGERLKLYTFDKTGNGLPLWQMLDPEAVGTDVGKRRTPDHIARRIRGYGFAQKVAVEFDDRELRDSERPEDAVIQKNVVSFAADELRKYIDQGRIELPYDRELLTEWQGQEIQYVRDESAAAGVSTKLIGRSLHTLDAAFMMIAGRNLLSIERILNMRKPPRRPVLAQFLG